MSYRNAREVFPPEVLALVQQYVEGDCVYIPRRTAQNRRTGREELCERNAKIRGEYAEGRSVRMLAETYFLSSQAIYKILAEKK